MPKRIQLTLGDETWTAEVSGDRVLLGPQAFPVGIERAGDRATITTGARTYTGRAVATGDTVWVSIAGEVFVVDVRRGARRDRSATLDHDAFTPPMSATVVRIAVSPGDAVRDGDVLISLEAMKMELPIRAPRDGVVRAVHCREGDLVQPDQVLLELE